ncbi:DUF3159 domain-containing protein [Actinomyces timonensis]|uniref:DUF3159 domain-containing protein n=1 Tax=Actinomyces timonensis TaxID=1288391 RepID=UPI00031591BB|nr:DUF3159 domain-containing protein [Actinomyces timonensis]
MSHALSPEKEPGAREDGLARPTGGLGAIGGQVFDVSAAVGGWRGIIESVAPTLVFVTVVALRPSALVPALVASLAISAVALVARLAARQGLTQVIGGAVLALISAAWAWRTGKAEDFYITGLLINAGWLAVTAGSLALRWPLVGVLMGLWRATTDSGDGQGWAAWRKDPALKGDRRRYTWGTAVLAGMFALRLVVELPLYLAGAVGPLGVARIILGVPLYALTLWIVWLLVLPRD